MSSGSSSACRIALCSAVKGVLESPWYERVQSTCLSLSSRVGGGSTRPSVRERREPEVSGVRLLLSDAVGLATWGAAVCGVGVRPVGLYVAGAGRCAGAAALGCCCHGLAEEEMARCCWYMATARWRV